MVCTRMLHASVPNVLSIFKCMLQVCLSGCCICFTQCCKCFIWMLLMCCNGFQVCFHVFLQLFQTHISSVFVVSIAFGCFKSRCGVAHSMCVGSGRGASGARASVWHRPPGGRAKHRRQRAMSERRGPSRGPVKWKRGNGLQPRASVRISGR
jgi:hypothetical protein